MKNIVNSYLLDLATAISNINPSEIHAAAQKIYDTYKNGGRVFICGNGGSAATASHMVCDLMKNTGVPIHAICMSDNIPLLTAVANDEDYSEVFNVFPVTDKDTLIAISTSGNSPNVVEAITHFNGTVILLTGNNDRSVCEDILLIASGEIIIHVQSDNIGVVEDVHLMINHMITEIIRELGKEK